MLAGDGAVLGVALTFLGTQLVSRLSSFDIPLLARAGVDARVLALAAVVALVTGVLVGLLPALNAPADVHDSLKDGPRGCTRGGRHARVRGALVVAEIAATVFCSWRRACSRAASSICWTFSLGTSLSALRRFVSIRGSAFPTR